MGKTRLYISPPGTSQKASNIFKELLSRISGNDFSRVLYLVPDMHVMSDVKDQFLEFMKDAGRGDAYIPFKLITPGRLALELHDDYASSKRVISDEIRTLMLSEYLGDTGMGYARILSGLLRKIRYYAADDLLVVRDKIAELIIEDMARERAIGAIDLLLRYTEQLRVMGLMDTEDVLLESISLISGHLAPEILIIGGFYDPAPLEMRLISALIARAGAALIMSEEGTGIEYHVRESFNADIRRLESAQRGASPYFYTFPSREEEVEGIAREVKSLILQGALPWKITVCFPVSPAYTSMVRRVFARYKLPCSTGEMNAASAGIIAALKDLIICVEEDYPRTAFLSLLIAPCFNAISAEVKDHALNFAYRAGIVKGRKGWLSAREIIINTGAGEDLRELEILDAFQRETGLLIKMIDGLKATRDLNSFIAAFEETLGRLGFFTCLRDMESEKQGEGLTQALALKLLELRSMAHYYNNDLRRSQTPWFYLKNLLSGITINSDSRDGVRVLPFEAAAGIETDTLFLGGLVEGDLPCSPEMDPVLPEWVKKKLGLPNVDFYMDRQRAYFKRLLNLPAREPYLSCPAAEGEKVFLPSPYLDWEQVRPAPELDIYTEEDVLVSIGASKKMSAPLQEMGNDGVSDIKTQELLTQRIKGMARGSLRVTDLDFYRKCPQRFYIEKVLGLEVELPPKFEVEARLWGSLAHTVMENTFAKGDVKMSALEAGLSAGLDKALLRFPLGHFWELVARAVFSKLAPLIIEREAALREEGYSPCAVEQKVKTGLSEMQIIGKVDRADRLGQDGRKIVELIDYKTGAVDRDSLQIPLYIHMWKEQFGEEVSRAGYYSLKDGSVQWYPKKGSMDEYVQAAMQKVDKVISDILNGYFPSVPAGPGECKFCCNASICRVGAE
ncbi:MAG: PD-(D/E)XK nuclease family protein [Nitrospira sp.]|nr:PD-(D/E)XK nuclease family protein [Nitrospira sp.]